MAEAQPTTAALKAEGNALFGAGEWLRAAGSFTKALALQASALTPPEELAVLHSNRSAAFVKLFKASKALADADAAAALRPEWPKAHYRRAVALELAGRHADALAALDAVRVPSAEVAQLGSALRAKLGASAKLLPPTAVQSVFSFKASAAATTAAAAAAEAPPPQPAPAAALVAACLGDGPGGAAARSSALERANAALVACARSPSGLFRSPPGAGSALLRAGLLPACLAACALGKGDDAPPRDSGGGGGSSPLRQAGAGTLWNAVSHAAQCPPPAAEAAARGRLLALLDRPGNPLDEAAEDGGGNGGWDAAAAHAWLAPVAALASAAGDALYGPRPLAQLAADALAAGGGGDGDGALLAAATVEQLLTHCARAADAAGGGGAAAAGAAAAAAVAALARRDEAAALAARAAAAAGLYRLAAAEAKAMGLRLDAR